MQGWPPGGGPGGPYQGGPPGWGQPPGRPPSSNRGLVLAIVGLAVVLVAVAGGVLLLGDDDESSEERDAYIEALTAIAAETEMGRGDENRCLAEGAFDTFGVDALREIATPDELLADPGRNLSDRGLEITQAQGEQLYTVLDECVGAREAFHRGAAGEDQQVAACVDAGLNDDLLRRLLVANFVEGETYLDSNPDLAAELADAIGHCE
jgi:hypothetical protein